MKPDLGRRCPELPDIVADARHRRKEGLSHDNAGEDQDSRSDRTGERAKAEGMEGGQGGMKRSPSTMTNRELFTEYERSNKSEQYPLVEEMTKRIGRKMITKEVVPLFKQYKLNGAGDKYN